jgi:threonine/homoserine/homoserine lactone efflux protein
LEELSTQYLATSLIIFAVAVIVDSIWLAIGSGIRSIFANPRSARATRILFALSIVFATLWTLFG